MVTADHGLAGARYAENSLELHHFHLDLKDVKAFTVCGLSKILCIALISLKSTVLCEYQI